MRFDPLIVELEREMRPRFPAVALLQAYWMDRLPTLLAWSSAEIPQRPHPRLALHLDVQDARAHQDDWSGDLELWPDSEDAVLVRRVALYDEGLQTVTLAAAPSRAVIERALARLWALWLRWRREKARGSAGSSEIKLHEVGWDDLCLPSSLLGDVRTTVEAFGRSRETYKRWNLPYRRGLLFHGPPGNGKTMLCRAIVSALGWPVVFVDGSDNQHGMRHAFSEAEDLAPAVICFEDVDSLFQGQAALSAFLNRLDGFETEEGLLVLATTNHPEKLDPALTSRPSRFDRVYGIPDPDAPQRQRYLGRLFGSLLPEDAVGWLASESEGMSMAFLKEIFVSAALRATARGATDPALEDVRAALPALLAHRRTAAKAFAQAQALGFGARSA
jgi:hypothetical protein